MCWFGVNVSTSEVSTQTGQNQGYIKPCPVIGPGDRKIYSYNLTDGDGFNKDKLLDNNNIAVFGVDNEYTSKYGGFDKYFESICDATHIITYKSKTGFGSAGGIFQNIYKIDNPIILKDIEAYQKHTGLSLSDMTSKLWKGKEDWYAVEGSAAIVWDAKLVKEITIPFKDSHIRTRTRFGSVNENHEIYNLI